MRRSAKTKQPYTLSLLGAGSAQDAKTDDARTQQRRGVQIVQLRRQRKYEVCPGRRVLGVTSVDGVPGESRRVAEIFIASPAIPARSVGASDPGNANPAS